MVRLISIINYKKKNEEMKEVIKTANALIKLKLYDIEYTINLEKNINLLEMITLLT